MKKNFDNAAEPMQVVSLGHAATAYVFYINDNRYDVVFNPDNIVMKNSESDLSGSERPDTDMIQMNEDDMEYDARRVAAAMPQMIGPKVVVYVHEPSAFHFSEEKVAQELGARSARPQESFFARALRATGVRIPA